MRAAILGVLLTVVAVSSAAQPFSGQSARGQLFPTRGVQVAVSPSLSELERATITAMVSEADRTGQSFRYYGSIAYSPSEGMTGRSISGAFNYHSTRASDQAAIAACNAARASGSQPCEVAAQILPRGYESGRVQLSYDATNAFRSTYLRHRGSKAFAISPATGAWRMAEGVDANDAATTAVALCNEDATKMGGAADCTPAIVD